MKYVCTLFFYLIFQNLKAQVSFTTDYYFSLKCDDSHFFTAREVRDGTIRLMVPVQKVIPVYFFSVKTTPAKPAIFFIRITTVSSALSLMLLTNTDTMFLELPAHETDVHLPELQIQQGMFRVKLNKYPEGGKMAFLPPIKDCILNLEKGNWYKGFFDFYTQDVSEINGGFIKYSAPDTLHNIIKNYQPVVLCTRTK